MPKSWEPEEGTRTQKLPQNRWMSAQEIEDHLTAMKSNRSARSDSIPEMYLWTPAQEIEERVAESKGCTSAM